MTSVAESGAAVIDFKSSSGLGRSTAFHEVREDVERRNVEVGDGVGIAHCET